MGAGASIVLRPVHIGEALVTAMLDQMSTDRFLDLPVWDPREPSSDKRMRQYEDSKPTVACDVRFEGANGEKFDGMHRIDVALRFPTRVRAMELKLGETGLAAGSFAKRFGQKRGLTSHATKRVAGSMVSLLERNRSDGADSLALSVDGVEVHRDWFVMLARHPASWRGPTGIAASTRQLCGVLALEEVVEAFGRAEARTLAREIANTSIDSWFVR